MPFVAAWMYLEMIILSEICQTEKDKYDITYTWNLKYDTSKLTQKTETDSQPQKINFWLPKGKGMGG